jgi:hypothetical protein
MASSLNRRVDRAVAKSDTRKGRASDRKVHSSQGEIEAEPWDLRPSGVVGAGCERIRLALLDSQRFDA